MTKKVVMVVDDEPGIRLLVRVLLGSRYSVIEAQDGREAIKLARSKKPDLILLDILMPEIDGYMTCEALKQDSKTMSIPIIMLSGLGFDLNKRLAEKSGADGYITKPFREEVLLKKVASCWSAK